MNLDQALQIFIAECGELMQEMEDRLLDTSSLNEPDAIDSIFRAIHTIKGSAGLFSLDKIVEFTHVVESVLDKVRAKQLELDEQLINLMLECKDHTGKLVDSIEGGQEKISSDSAQVTVTLLSQLNVYLGDSNQTTVNTDNKTTDNTPQQNPSSNSGVGNPNWHISVRFTQDCIRNGLDPLSQLRYLQTIGTVAKMVSVFAIPNAEQMDPESCYMGFEINFQADISKEALEDAFEFFREDCVLKIVAPHAEIAAYRELVNAQIHPDADIPALLVQCGSLTVAERLSLQPVESTTVETERFEQVTTALAQQSLAAPEEAIETDRVDTQAPTKKTMPNKGQTQTIRVDAEKLDQLINLVGELVIAGAGVSSEAHSTRLNTLKEASLNLNNLIEEVRDSALNLRMVQIGETFNRFNRVVRDISKELGKDIRLEISGADTELDKTVIEKISDPLMHLVRNSIDHGIEQPEKRIKSGKDAKGSIKLNAYHDSGSIVIEVIDDGKGLNREQLLKKATEKGLITAESESDLTDSEVFNLIFHAGFSTAEKVSNISGRGVGMDVVRRNIEALRGSIEIDSRFQIGTTIRVRLPLTLAIIDGFMMGVGDASYVVPLDIVEECIELSKSNQQIQKGRNYIDLRGEVLPYIRLRDYFNESGSAEKRENVVVVKYGQHKAGFVVDRLMGELQTVIKPLGKLFGNNKGISGSTVLGTGEVALILDPVSLINQAINSAEIRIN